MLRWLPALLLTACVVRYGPPPGGPPVDPLPQEPQDPPVDFNEVVQRLDALLLATEEVDQRDRLDAARNLARRMRDEEPRAQRIVLAYLQHLVEVEERSRPTEGLELYAGEQASFQIGGAPIVEEELEAPPPPDPEPAPAPAVEPIGPDPVPATLLQRAADQQQAGDLAQALATLEACLDRPCMAQVEARWAELRDAFVHQEREQAGVLFLRARDEADPVVRLAALQQIRQRLADLADRYPNSPLADDLRRNVDLVQRAIEEANAALARQADGDPPPAAAP